MAESKIAPKWHIFVSIVSREIKENVEKYSQSGYYNLFFKANLSATRMNPKTHWQEVERVDESEIFPNRQVFVFIVGQ